MASDQQHNAQAMFNLGYMHEQGLGMQRDWHLAKRCYDLAAVTSVDARVPVALALLKLSLLFQLDNLKDVRVKKELLNSSVTSNSSFSIHRAPCKCSLTLMRTSPRTGIST